MDGTCVIQTDRQQSWRQQEFNILQFGIKSTSSYEKQWWQGTWTFIQCAWRSTKNAIQRDKSRRLDIA